MILNHTIDFDTIKDTGLLQSNTISDFVRYTNGIINEINRADDTGIFAHFLINNSDLSIIESNNVDSLQLVGGALNINFTTPSNRSEYIVLAQFRRINVAFPAGHEMCYVYYANGASDSIQLIAGENSSADTGVGDIDNAGIGYPRSVFLNTSGGARGWDYFSAIII